MSREPDHNEFDDLSVPEQINHVQTLWNRIADGSTRVELTQCQREELDRRLREHEENPGDYASWEQIRQRLEGQSR
jgi:putative addiction module component (TIGR02574 family)